MIVGMRFGSLVVILYFEMPTDLQVKPSLHINISLICLVGLLYLNQCLSLF